MEILKLTSHFALLTAITGATTATDKFFSCFEAHYIDDVILQNALFDMSSEIDKMRR